MSDGQDTIVFGIIRKSLEATVIYACPHCEAPGVDHRGHPVGNICPKCGGYRRRDKILGELSASMPRWLWNCILGIKLCVITLKRRIGHG